MKKTILILTTTLILGGCASSSEKRDERHYERTRCKFGAYSCCMKDEMDSIPREETRGEPISPSKYSRYEINARKRCEYLRGHREEKQ